MTFIAEHLLRRLPELEGQERADRYVVAFSGGLDSTTLLHALAASRGVNDVSLVALHVNHALQPDADRWEEHCRAFARDLDVPFDVCRVVVPTGDGRSLEAAAREARYAAIMARVQPGDVVLSAHHEDDQAETLLINLLRGSGPAGLAGIGSMQRLGPGRLCRPLLDVPRQALLEYARHQGLDWVEDPSNGDPGFDRNFLRREVLPRLTERWPAATTGLRRSAELAAESRLLQHELADLDLTALARPPGNCARLDTAGLTALSPVRQRNVLKRAIELSGLPPAPSKRLFEAVATLLPAPPDAQPLIRWPGAELRRYRQLLFILRAASPVLPVAPLSLGADGRALELGPGLGRLRLEEDTRGGMRPQLVGSALSVRFRRGGEKLKPQGRRESHRLKELLRSAGVVPWMRPVIPLLYAGESLVAVADLWVDTAAFSAPGMAVRWEGRPALT